MPLIKYYGTIQPKDPAVLDHIEYELRQQGWLVYAEELENCYKIYLGVKDEKWNK